MKLMVRVRPGVELTCATFCPRRELMRLDLPTLERPRKANSGGPSRGKASDRAEAVMNLAIGAFMSNYHSKHTGSPPEFQFQGKTGSFVELPLSSRAEKEEDSA